MVGIKSAPTLMENAYRHFKTVASEMRFKNCHRIVETVVTQKRVTLSSTAIIVNYDSEQSCFCRNIFKAVLPMEFYFLVFVLTSCFVEIRYFCLNHCWRLMSGSRHLIREKFVFLLIFTGDCDWCLLFYTNFAFYSSNCNNIQLVS